MSTGMILDGVFASQAIDSSGEILDIDGCDISTLAKDGVANYEHKEGDKKVEGGGNNGEEVVGRIIYAKKVFSVSDCDTDREEKYWEQLKVPFIYGMVRLYDAAGHSGAQALAAQVRDHHANAEPLLVRYSIEGSTLERAKDQPNRLTISVARRIAMTLKPCNRTAISGLISDPKAPEGFEKQPETDKHVLRVVGIEKTERLEHPLYTRLGGSVEQESNPFIDDDTMAKLKLIAKATMLKALEAGVGGAAPSALTQGAALQREDRGLKARAMAAVRDYGKKKFDKGEFRAFAKTYLPEADDNFLDHFTDVAEDYHMKRAALNKKETPEEQPKRPKSWLQPIPGQEEPANLLADEPKKATAKQLEFPPRAPSGIVKDPAAGSQYPEPKAGIPIRGEGPRPPAALTIRGKPVQPTNVKAPVFDEATGIFHMPPQKPGWRVKQDPETDEEYQEYAPGHSGGQFPMYIPGRSDDHKHGESFAHLLEHDQHVNKFHDYAMENWVRMHQHFKAGTLPPEVVMHAALFSMLSPNTPVPMQELMYGHLVDSMKHNGIDARSPRFANLRQDWLDRDDPHKLPDTSPEHWQRLGDQIRVGDDSMQAKRKPGELQSFMLANNKFNNMAQYHSLHDALVDLVGRHKGDARAAAAELMHHKNQANLVNNRIKTAQRKGVPAPEPYSAGPSVPGLAPKTTRYTLGMLGGGNVQVPDTHFTRYLFGLEKGAHGGPKVDNDTIEALKTALWNKKNGHVLEGIDRYYAAHHPAVAHMMNHPRWGHVFEGDPQQAIFPAFWKNWVSIVPHERARGYNTSGENEGTDHRVFWDNTIPLLGKSEGDVGLAARTAMIHHKWVQEHGEIPALMLYYRHLAPKLMANALARDVDHQIRKAEALSVDLKKAMADDDAARGDYSYWNKPVEFGGNKVIPGAAWTTKGKYALLHEDDKHYVAVPHDRVYDFDPKHLVKLPKAKEGTHFYLTARPTVAVADLDK
jgi:hypothetical protein